MCRNKTSFRMDMSVIFGIFNGFMAHGAVFLAVSKYNSSFAIFEALSRVSSLGKVELHFRKLHQQLGNNGLNIN